MAYTVSNDFIGIIANTNSRFSRAYLEASETVKNDDKKAAEYIKNFVISIENIANKNGVKDTDISKSHGNIKSYKGYDYIKKCISFIKSNYKNMMFVDDLDKMVSYLENNTSIYEEGYTKQVRLIILEYENMVYLATSGCATLLAHVDFTEKNGNVEYSIVKDDKYSGTSMLSSSIKEFNTVVATPKHREYIDALLKAKKDKKINTSIKESTVFTEGTVADTIELIDHLMLGIGHLVGTTKNIILSIKNSIFGVVPLIRTVLYMRYKTKANTVLALEQQMNDIEMNINTLRNRKDLDDNKKELIIKRQQAIVEKYRKRAAKLRAQLSDGDREAKAAVEQENPSMGKSTNDDDFVLEGGVTVKDIFSNNEE